MSATKDRSLPGIRKWDSANSSLVRVMLFISYITHVGCRVVIIACIASLLGCTDETNKREWGALQVMESRHRGAIEDRPIFDSVDGCEGVGIRNLLGQEVWILLNARSNPYFKQLPTGVDISMNPILVELILKDSSCSAIVREELRRANAVPPRR